MRRVFALFAALLMAVGCTDYYVRSADREVEPILNQLQETVATERPAETPAGVINPKPEGAQINPGARGGVDPIEEAMRVWASVCKSGYECYGEPLEIMQARAQELVLPMALPPFLRAIMPLWRAAAASQTIEPTRFINLTEALELAFSNGRDFKRQKESLYLSVLSYTLTLHNYSWVGDASAGGDISLAGNGSSPSTTSAGADATLSLAKRLLSGGSFNLSASLSQSGSVDGPASDSSSSSVSAGFSQPLLAESGVAAREQMVQARRSLLYAARDFELFRENLAIDLIQKYYDLLRQRRFIESARQRVEQAQFLYDRSRALFDKGMGTKVDELRAKQEFLQAQNGLNTQIESYSIALDRFKLDLSLPTGENIDVAEEPIEPVIITVDLAKAVESALANRLDLLTERMRLEDVERSVEIARNALLPQLQLSAQAGLSSDGDLLDYNIDDGSASLSLSLSGFVDKKAARNSYRSALIALDRARRGYALTEDNVTLDVRSTVSALRSAEVSVAIQREQVQDAEDRLEVALINLERGEAGNRDVVEAQTALQDAKDSLVQAKVDYLLAEIRLRKNIGTLRVDERGLLQ